ncbi:MAG: hypothetical protein ACRD5H_06065, partial [Nitrososphaerales archaeon]
ISVPVRTNKNHGLDLTTMLRITESLLKLKKYAGFEKLVNGFRNPGNLLGTLFEVQAAHWCSERQVTLSMEFSPSVRMRNGYKHPDFLWKTSLGDLFCECKSGAEFEGKFAKRFQFLYDLVEEKYRKHGLAHPKYRVDLRLDSSTKNGIEKRIETVLNEISGELRSEEIRRRVIQDGEVTAVLSLRDEPVSEEKDMLRGRTVTVRTEPTLIVGAEAYKNSQFTVTMSIRKERQKLTAKLLKEARTQLPLLPFLSCVFIELGGGEAATQDLKTRLANPTYSNTPWVSVWIGGQLYTAVWRNDQPLDAGLLSATTSPA